MSNPADWGQHSRWLGHSWIRFSFSEFSWGFFLRDGRYSPISFGEYEDRAIDALVENDITILYNLTFFDPEVQTAPGYIRFKDEAEIQCYLDYVKLVVTHFKGRIQYYETWNEPDLAHVDDQQSIDLEDYISVVKRVLPVIHEADPQAKVVLGASSNLVDPSTMRYLDGLIQSDLMPLVDGIAIHPMYGAAPDYAKYRDYYYNYPEMIRRVKETAATHGFKGDFFAEEMVWRTKDNIIVNFEEEYYSEMVVAKYYARGIVINRGLGVYPGIGGEGHDQIKPVVTVLRNLNTILSGVQPVEVSVQVDNPSIQLRHYTFSLPNGELLIALWTDGVAVDDDPGIEATLVFPGLSAQQVVGIDILHGFQQQQIMSDEDGNLVLRNLLVKDYPVFLRLMP